MTFVPTVTAPANLALWVSVPVATEATNVPLLVSYTPTLLEWRGANTTLFPSAAAPSNFMSDSSSLRSVPVETEALNVLVLTS
eukprot:3620435-Prymnesium_polylepis.1